MINQFVPSGPSFIIDIKGINDAYPWFRNLRGSTQDPIHHAEGDVWTHTLMVCEEMDEDNMGRVVQATKEKARELLRKKQSFVWDSTNLIKKISPTSDPNGFGL
jgi:hypothetical protein